MHPNTLTEFKRHIAETLDHLGYSRPEITAFLAGAAIFGHLRPGGSADLISSIIRTRLDHAAPIDDIIGAAGRLDQPTPTPTPKT